MPSGAQVLELYSDLYFSTSNDQVKPATSEEDLRPLAVGDNSQFIQLIRLGNIQGATQFANALLETVDLSDGKVSIQDKKAVRIKLCVSFCRF